MVSNKMKKRIAVTIVIVILVSVSAFSASASFEGLAADRLVITVGYFGGPYYEKAVFTADEMWALDVQYLDYTAIDNMPSVVITHAAGVTLSDLMDAAGIDLGSVQSFNFWTNDKEGGYYNSMTKAFLIDTPRYCYYTLPDNFDYDEGCGNEYATADGVRVPTMIALADDWRRSLAGASFGSDYINLDSSVRFRLVYGQTDAVTRTASDSAKWIHRIEVTLGGAPTLTLDASVLDLEVGSRYRSEARISAADPVIAANAEIIWSSSDERIAAVDEAGEITVHAEGRVTVTAEWGGQSVSVVVSGTEAAEAINDEQLTINDGESIEHEREMDSGGNAGEFGIRDSELHIDGGAYALQETAGHDLDADNEAEGMSASEYDIPDEPADELQIALSDAFDDFVTLEATIEFKPELIGRELSIIASSDYQSNSDLGGVQNWRRDEMASTAVELPIIPNEVKMTYIFIALILFFLGGLVEFTRSKHP